MSSEHMAVWAVRWPVGAFIEAQRLHDDYETWCAEVGIPQMGEKARCDVWKALGFHRVRHGRGRWWKRYAEPVSVEHEGLWS